MPFLTGPAPIRRTLNYLNSGYMMLKDKVSIIEVHYNMYWRQNNKYWSLEYEKEERDREDPREIAERIRDQACMISERGRNAYNKRAMKARIGPRCIPKIDNHTGTREFYFWEVPRIQYQNPTVQIVRFLENSPIPFLRVWLDDGSEDVLFDCDNKDRNSILQQLKKTLGLSVEEQERIRRQRLQVNEAIFGFNRRTFCPCEIPDQVPCPGTVPLPMRMQGKYTRVKTEELEAWENDLSKDYPTEKELLRHKVAFPMKHEPILKEIPGLETMYMRKPKQQTRPFKQPTVITEEYDVKRMDKPEDRRLMEDHKQK